MSDSLVARSPAEGNDPEVETLRRRYRAEFKAAFEAATLELTSRERAVLRYSLDGWTAEDIARIHHVHRVTVARWLGSIRSRLLAGTRTHLQRSLSSSPEEVDSLLRLADGDLSLSLDRLLPGPRGRK